jgi:uncharacterized protein
MMVTPNLEEARQYALTRLANELPEHLTYHCIQHTRDHVVPTVRRLANYEGVDDQGLLLLETAAYFHDIGFVESWENHEQIGIRIAREVLPQFGYLPDQIDVITQIIMATRLPQSPQTQLEKIMTDADLDSLGRVDFFERNQALRDEYAALGKTYSDEDWFYAQYKFIHEHDFFTASARALRQDQKQKNIEALLKIVNCYQTIEDKVDK